ncbi:MAG: NUDIX domain-containing protein [Candidatus Paceibacterota bacterium]
MKSQRKFATEHLRFAILAVDIALMTVRDGALMIRLTPVNRPPHFPNSKGLPGGLIEPSETAEEAALRLIRDRATICSKHIYFEQLYTFSELNRDPRGRVVAVAYLAVLPWEDLAKEDQEDTNKGWWVTIPEATKLAYDHDLITAVAVQRLRSRARYTTILRHLMPTEFTLSELETVYESILKTDLDKRNFRKKLLKLKAVIPLGRKKKHGAHRPAELYRFAGTKVEEIEII